MLKRRRGHKEYYSDAFLVHYSSKGKGVPLILRNVLDTKDAIPRQSDWIITSTLSGRYRIEGHIAKILDFIKEQKLPQNFFDRQTELVTAFQPHKETAIAGYLFDHKTICALAKYSLALGITNIYARSDLIKTNDRRNTIYKSRKRFKWDNTKYLYSNHGKRNRLFSINLSFADKKLNPQRITEITGIDPDVSFVKGEMIYPKSKSRKRTKQGVWKVICENFEDKHKTLHEALRLSLQNLYPYRKKICRAARQFKCERNVSIAFTSLLDKSPYEHYRFSPEFFKILEPFGVDLALSIWQPWETD